MASNWRWATTVGCCSRRPHCHQPDLTTTACRESAPPAALASADLTFGNCPLADLCNNKKRSTSMRRPQRLRLDRCAIHLLVDPFPVPKSNIKTFPPSAESSDDDFMKPTADSRDSLIYLMISQLLFRVHSLLARPPVA